MKLLATPILVFIVCATISRGENLDPNGKFSPCKGTRTLNSLEMMKVQGLVTRIGAKCVGSKIVQFMNKHKVPVFAFPALIKSFCQATIVGYTHFAVKDDLVLAKGTTSEELLVLFKSVFKVAEGQNWTVADRRSGKVFHVPVTEFIEFGLDRLSCIMKIEKNPVKDANWILFGTNHMLRILTNN